MCGLLMLHKRPTVFFPHTHGHFSTTSVTFTYSSLRYLSEWGCIFLLIALHHV